MIDEQIENWIRKMQTACNRSALDSDINIIKLIQHIEDLYEQGRADERDKCAQLLDDFAKTEMVSVKDTWRMGVMAAANAVRDKK